MTLSMKRITSLFALCAFVTGTLAVAQNISVPNLASGVQTQNRGEPAKSQKIVKVATITGADAVHEFQHNMSVLQAGLAVAKDLQAQVEKETDKKKKQELQSKLDAALKKLDSDNAVMAKTYGFSLTRSYVVDPETISLYTIVSDEEAAKVEEASKQQAKEQPKSKK